LRQYGSNWNEYETVSESFDDDIKGTECSPIEIRLFCYDIAHMPSAYVNLTSSTANKYCCAK